MEKPIIQTNNIYYGDCYKLIKDYSSGMKNKVQILVY